MSAAVPAPVSRARADGGCWSATPESRACAARRRSADGPSSDSPGRAAAPALGPRLAASADLAGQGLAATSGGRAPDACAEASAVSPEAPLARSAAGGRPRQPSGSLSFGRATCRRRISSSWRSTSKPDVFHSQAAAATNKRAEQSPHGEVEEGESHAADPPSPQSRTDDTNIGTLQASSSPRRRAVASATKVIVRASSPWGAQTRSSCKSGHPASRPS
jgi:hypothetical protein